METPRVRLGELLVRAGLITAEHLEEALVEQRRVGKRLGTVLVHSGLVSETQVTQVLSQQLSVPWVSLHHIDFSRELLNLVPIDLVEIYCLIPIYVRRVRGLGDALYIAMDDPTNAPALAEVAERSRMHVRAMIAPPSDIKAALRAYYGVGEEEAPPAPAPKPPSAPRIEEPPQVLQSPALARPPMSAQAPPKKNTGKISDGLTARAASMGPAPAPATSGSVASLGPPLASARGQDAPEATSAGAEGRPSVDMSNVSRPPAKPVHRGGARMIALTLLDGTTIRLPAKQKPAEAPPAEGARKDTAPPPSNPDLTARDLIAALRAAAKGADASEVLGENARWEAMFAAVLSVLLKKHLIADWEFVEEFKKI